ncbi:MAG TPA: hypothetical protein VFZ40_04555 [Pyrinomonadaceae bacterium]
MVVKVVLAASAVLVSIVLSGCVVVFTNPLPVSQPLGLDKRLLGRWAGKDEQGNDYSIRFETRANGNTVVSLPDVGYRNPLFRVVTTEISTVNYLILRLDDPSDDKTYMVGSYSIGGDSLTICLLNEDRIRAAIKQGRLKGKLANSPWGGATITENSKSVLAFLASPNSKDLFTCPGELKKVATN